MVKIEITVIDSDNGNCQVSLKPPKHLKSATDTEKKTANAVHMTLANALKSISE